MSPSFRRADNSEPRPITCPALILTLALALGIALSSRLDPSAATGVWTLIPLLIAASGACLLGAAILVRAGRAGASAIVVLAGCVLAGAALPVLFAYRFPPDHIRHLEAWGFDLDRALEVEGRVITEPIQTPSGLEFDLEATRLDQAQFALVQGTSPLNRPASGKIRVRLQSFAGASGSAGVPEAQRGAGLPDVFSLHPGDAVRAMVLLRRPRVYQNPGSFDFRKRAADIEDLYWQGSVEGTDAIRKLAGHSGPSGLSGFSERAMSRWVWRARVRVRRSIDRLYPPWSPEGRDGAVLKAVLLGDRSSVDSVTIDHFRASGLYHLLVIAGLHVGLIAGLVLGFLRLLRLNRTQRNLLLLLILLSYALLVEQRAPTLRATLMILTFVVADLLNRGHSGLNSVGLAALILLLVRPLWLFESGFQLSFAAALLIVGLAGPLLRLSIEPYHRALGQLDNVDLDAALKPSCAQFRLDLRSLVSGLRAHSAWLDRHPLAAERAIVWPLDVTLRMVEIAALSAVLQIGLLLSMVETFHRVTLAGIGLNSLALPLMAVLLGIAIPTVMLATIAAGWAAVPGKILAMVFTTLFRLAEMPHYPGWLSYRVPPPPLLVALGFALSLIVLALCVGHSRARAPAPAAAFVVFAILLATEPFSPGLTSGKSLEVTVLDCGRGQASFVVFPGGSTMLIGTCSLPSQTTRGLTARWDPGENIVAPYLWSRRVKNVDVLVVPGSNLDGAGAILDGFHVRELWLAPMARGADARVLQALSLHVLERGTRLRPISPGDVLRLGTTVIQVAADDFTTAQSTEDTEPSSSVPSVVSLQLTDGSHSVLFAGSGLSRRAADLDGFASGSGARVLIIDRPGLVAAARSNMLAGMGAEAAIVAPGRTMREDRTARRDLAGLDPRMPIFETDIDGAVTARSESGSVGIRTFRGRIARIRGR